MGLSSLRARAKASSPQGYQSTGLCACCSRYGLVSRASRFSLTGWPSALERQIADGGGHDALADAHADGGAGLGMLTPHEAQGQRPAEAERERGAGDRADGGIARHDLATGGRD